MFDLDKYLADLIMNCRSTFGERLLYMGLQGSWLRGEANENSDIDVMVILDRVFLTRHGSVSGDPENNRFLREILRVYLRRRRVASLESLGGLPTAPYNKRPVRRIDGLSSVCDTGGRSQLCQSESGKSVSRAVPSLHSCRQRQKCCEVPRHLQRSVFPDTEFALSVERPIYLSQERLRGTSLRLGWSRDVQDDTKKRLIHA